MSTADEGSPVWFGPGDMHGIANLEQKIDAMAALDIWIAEALPLMTSDVSLLDRLMAAAALARCRRLVLGMITLSQQNLNDLSSMPLRPIFETWVTGLYVLNYPDALKELTEHLSRERDKFGRYNIIPVFTEALIDTSVVVPSTIEMCQRVTTALKRQGAEHPNAAINNYHLLFRGESSRNSHGGLGSVGDHLLVHPDGAIEVTPVRRELSSGVKEVILGAVMTKHLALSVGAAFRFDTISLLAQTSAITQAIDFTVGLEDAVDGLNRQSLDEMIRGATPRNPPEAP